MNELKRCPFCGGEATLMRIQHNGVEIVCVKCKACEATAAPFSAPVGRLNPRAKADDPMFEKVRYAWNRRVE